MNSCAKLQNVLVPQYKYNRISINVGAFVGANKKKGVTTAAVTP